MKAVLCKELGPPEKLVVEDVPSLKAGQGPGGGEREGGRGQLSRHADHPGQVSVQARAAVLARRRSRRRGQGTGRGRDAASSRATASSPPAPAAASPQEMVADADRLIPMPDAMDFVPASAFVLTYGTSYHALKDRAQLKAGETLLVLGASGGVGLAAIQIGKAMGAQGHRGRVQRRQAAVCKEQRRRRADQLRHRGPARARQGASRRARRGRRLRSGRRSVLGAGAARHGLERPLSGGRLRRRRYSRRCR